MVKQVLIIQHNSAMALVRCMFKNESQLGTLAALAGGKRRTLDQDPLPRIYDENFEAVGKQHCDSERSGGLAKMDTQRALSTSEDELSHVSTSAPSGTE